MLRLMPVARSLPCGLMMQRFALWTLNAWIAIHIRMRPVRVLLEISLPANRVHCKWRGTTLRQRGAAAIANIASFFNAIKQTLYREDTDNARGQREYRLHISVAGSLACCRCVVPLLVAKAMSLSDDAIPVLMRLTLLSLRSSATNMYSSGCPGSNQGPSDCCRHLQSDALQTEL